MRSEDMIRDSDDAGAVKPTTRSVDAAGPVRAEDPLAGLKTDMGWQNAWMTAMAMAWANEADKQALISHPEIFFRERLGWEVPEGLRLVVTDEPSHVENGQRLGWNQAQQAWYLAKTEVRMFLPPKPAVDQQGVALASYLATGRTYPFTTC